MANRGRRVALVGERSPQSDRLLQDGQIVAAILDVGVPKVAPARRKTFAQIATAQHLTEKQVTTAWERARPLLRAALRGHCKA